MDTGGNLLLDLGRHWLMGFGEDMVRYIIAAPLTWLVLCVICAPLLKSHKIRPDSPPAMQLVIEFLCLVRSVAVFSTVSLLSILLWKAGLLWGGEWRENAGPLWIVVSFVITVIAHDAYFYWAHRIMHHPRLFRTFHRRHHRSHNPTPFTAYSFDLAEAAVMASFTVIWELIVPVSWVGFTAFLIHQIARNVIGHSGYELFPARKDGKPLFDWMTTVTHHDLHHSQAGYNYGLYFTWWDRWMGTEHPRYHARFAAAAGPRRAALAAAE